MNRLHIDIIHKCILYIYITSIALFIISFLDAATSLGNNRNTIIYIFITIPIMIAFNGE